MMVGLAPRWNGSYGYRTLYLLTGQQTTNTATVTHVGARHYSPSLRRWLQRDPIDLLGANPNLYAYCLNSPTRFVDPHGLIVWFLPGTFSGGDVFSSSFLAAVAYTLHRTGDLCHVFNWGSGPGDWPLQGNWNREALKFAEHVERYYKTQARAGEPLWIVGHSHGGTVALKASQILASKGIPIEGIVCLGMPLTLADKGPSAAPGNTTKAVWLVYEGLDLFFGVAYTFSDRKSGLDKVLAEWESYAGKCYLRVFNLPLTDYGDWSTHSEYLKSSVWRREIGPIFWGK